MKPQSISIKLIISLIVCFTCITGASTAAENPRQHLLMDFNWRFHPGHNSDINKDFEFGKQCMFGKATTWLKVNKDDFNDSDWESINLPHDWVVELPFDPCAEINHGFKPVGRNFPTNTIGWYRKTFDIPKEDEGKRMLLEFDGVFRDCYVWLNDFLLGRNFSGYNSFSFDVTDNIKYGDKNVLVVRADVTNQEGWFYEGGGIYRHVWLTKTNPVHIARWGTFVTSDIKDSNATINVQTKVINENNGTAVVELQSFIEDADGKNIAEITIANNTVEPWNQSQLSCKIKIKDTKLWSLESPYLYKLVSVVKQNGKIVDRYETPFGIRTISFDADKGFFLNGKKIFLKGTCNHQDHAGVGSALPDHIQYYRIKQLKEMGCNAYRTSHNPPTPELLEACDKLGMLVMDETRTMGSSPEVLGQLESMILRDRNHPCVVMWSLGNEEGSIQGNDYGLRIGKTMLRTVKNLDSTRPITMAMNGGYGKGMTDVVDIQGFNYNHQNIDAFRKAHPKMPILMSEDASTLCTRGIYQNDETKGYVVAYDANGPRWGYNAMDCLKFYAERPWIMGTFIWTGFDYRGEPTPYRWPCISSHFGIMDTCGYPKDNFYYYQAWWGDKTVLHILPHWNWAGKEGQDIDVRCLTNCSEVELFLNGKSLGRQSVVEYGDARWKVKYVPGTLLVKGYKDGKEIAQAKVETAGAPAKISLIPDCASINADGEDVSMVRVEIRDANDRICSPADNLVKFEISENGKIIGVGNGDPSSHESDRASQRKVFNGLAQVIVQSGKTAGDIKLTAQSDGLGQTDIIIKAQQCPLRPAVP
ncbi:MAG: beta-galactosidase GalA [Phycisphaerae bacterium]|jgi:beta-galactosidase